MNKMTIVGGVGLALSVVPTVRAVEIDLGRLLKGGDKSVAGTVVRALVEGCIRRDPIGGGVKVFFAPSHTATPKQDNAPAVAPPAIHRDSGGHEGSRGHDGGWAGPDHGSSQNKV
jgi:hypothetical protein